MALLDNSLYLGGSLNEFPFQGFIHKNYFTLNETIPGIQFNFTNSSIKLLESNGYVFESNDYINLDFWAEEKCAATTDTK